MMLLWDMVVDICAQADSDMVEASSSKVSAVLGALEGGGGTNSCSMAKRWRFSQAWPAPPRPGAAIPGGGGGGRRPGGSRDFLGAGALAREAIDCSVEPPF